MSSRQTFKDSRSVISSLELEFGPSLFVAQDGRTIDQSGREVAHASLSARQALELGFRTQDTFGQASPGSSSSEDLQSSLESRLQARLSSLGSTLYTLIWKPWNTPSGPSRFRLRASVRRTSETDCSGWPTPTTRDWKDGGNSQVNVPLNGLLGRVVWLAGWMTPTANVYNQPETPRGLRTFAGSAKLSGWPTPMADCNRGASAEEALRSTRPSGHKVQKRIQDIAAITGPVRLTACGEVRTGSDAGMESGGQLNPAHPRWLMGLPPEWDACAPTETLSMLKRRKSS